MSLSPTVPHNISQWQGGTWRSSTTNIQTVKQLCGLSVHIQCHSICTVQTDVLFCSLRFLSGDLQRWRIQLFFFLCVCFFTAWRTSSRCDPDKSERLPVAYLTFPGLRRRLFQYLLPELSELHFSPILAFLPHLYAPVVPCFSPTCKRASV